MRISLVRTTAGKVICQYLRSGIMWAHCHQQDKTMHHCSHAALPQSIILPQDIHFTLEYQQELNQLRSHQGNQLLNPLGDRLLFPHQSQVRSPLFLQQPCQRLYRPQPLVDCPHLGPPQNQPRLRRARPVSTQVRCPVHFQCLDLQLYRRYYHRPPRLLVQPQVLQQRQHCLYKIPQVLSLRYLRQIQKRRLLVVHHPIVQLLSPLLL